MKFKAKRKNAVIYFETIGYGEKKFKFIYRLLKMFRFEIKYCDWSDEDDWWKTINRKN